MAKTIKYNSVAERMAAEQDANHNWLQLVAILEDRNPGFYEEGLNKLFPQANGEPYSAEYTKPV